MKKLSSILYISDSNMDAAIFLHFFGYTCILQERKETKHGGALFRIRLDSFLFFRKMGEIMGMVLLCFWKKEWWATDKGQPNYDNNLQAVLERIHIFR